MALGVVLDACVLYPFSLCDILLRLAEREFYDPYWSDRILGEVERNLVQNRLTAQQAAWRVDAMRRTFPSAAVPEESIAGLEPAMTNDQKDRHVLAAAVASPAEAVVTFNLRHFPEQSCEPHGVDVLHPDEFLVSMFDLDPDAVAAVIQAQSDALRKPPIPPRDLIGMLSRAGVPEFAKRLA